MSVVGLVQLIGSVRFPKHYVFLFKKNKKQEIYPNNHLTKYLLKISLKVYISYYNFNYGKNFHILKFYIISKSNQTYYALN